MAKIIEDRARNFERDARASRNSIYASSSPRHKHTAWGSEVNAVVSRAETSIAHSERSSRNSKKLHVSVLDMLLNA